MLTRRPTWAIGRLLGSRQFGRHDGWGKSWLASWGWRILAANDHFSVDHCFEPRKIPYGPVSQTVWVRSFSSLRFCHWRIFTDSIVAESPRLRIPICFKTSLLVSVRRSSVGHVDNSRIPTIIWCFSFAIVTIYQEGRGNVVELVVGTWRVILHLH